MELATLLRQDLQCFAALAPEYPTWITWLRWVRGVLARELAAARARRCFLPGPGMCVLSFPTDRPMGVLRRHDPQGIHAEWQLWHRAPSDPSAFVWEFFALAQGTVVVPEGERLELLIMENGRWDPSPFPIKEPPSWLTREKIQAIRDDPAVRSAHLEEVVARQRRVRPAPIDLAFLERLPPNALYQLASSHTELVSEGLAPIRHLQGLGSLELRHPLVIEDRDLALLSEHRRLEALSAPSPWVSDQGLRALQGCTELRVLALGGPLITDHGMWHLRGCTKLETLYLGSTGVGTEDLAWIEGMTQLWGLGLTNTQVTRAGLARLAHLHNLHQLSLSSPHITEKDLAALRRALPRCDISSRS